MEVSRQAKIIILTEIISPYRIPVFNEIAQRLSGQFLVLFLGQTEKRREWKIYKENIKFNYEVLPHIMLQRKDSSPYFFNPTLLSRLIEYSPDIIIKGGYHQPSSFLAMLYTKLFKKRFILWCESNKYDRRSNQLLKEAYKRWFVRNCTGYIVPGQATFEYVISLGADAKKIRVAPNAVDNDYFSKICDKHRETKEELKKSKGYPKKLILFVGRLIEQKGVSDLLKAFQIISQEQPDLGLLLVGSSEGKESYKNFCQINKIKNVFFEGFAHQEELPVYYALADVFVLPTHSDPWGLVLNEAMACRLPVISSNAAGAAYDLVINGVNGYIVRAGDIQQLTHYLKDILSDEQKRTAMGQMSLSIINDYSPQKCAEGVIRAIKEIGCFYKQNKQENIIRDYNLEDYPNYWKGAAKLFLQKMEFKILHKIIPARAEWFIDVGCGYGRLLPIYRELNKKIVMVDYSTDLLAKCATIYHYENIYYIAANAYRLPFRNGSFDSGISIRAFHHMKFPQNFLNEFGRVMRKDAYAVLEYSNKRNLFRLFKHGARCFRHDHEEYEDLLFGTHPAYFTDVSRKAGFKILGNYGTGFFYRLLNIFPAFVSSTMGIETIFDLFFGSIALAPFTFVQLRKTSGDYNAVHYEKLADILMCPACYGSIIDAGSERVECRNCKRFFPKRNSVIDLRYLENK